jgi:hypothetical protein
MRGRSAAVAAFLALAIVVFAPRAGHAVLVNCDSDLPLTCTKDVTLSGTTLTITLNNTSPGDIQITALAFDLDGNITATLTSTTDPDFDLFTGPINVSPFGSREFSIGIDDDFEGGGNPNVGIQEGTSATFVLTLSADPANDAAFLAAEIASEVIRARGEAGSDKDQFTNGTPVPEPTTLLLLGGGLVALAAARRRRARS